MLDCSRNILDCGLQYSSSRKCAALSSNCIPLQQFSRTKAEPELALSTECVIGCIPQLFQQRLLRKQVACDSKTSLWEHRFSFYLCSTKWECNRSDFIVAETQILKNISSKYPLIRERSFQVIVPPTESSVFLLPMEQEIKHRILIVEGIGLDPKKSSVSSFGQYKGQN